MAGIQALRGDINAALCNPNFIAVAARLSGGFLRQVVAHRLAEAHIDVVVIAANALGETTPYKQAEIVWQLPEGGDFVRQTVRWDLAPWTFADEVPREGARATIYCQACGYAHGVTLDGSGPIRASCPHCGAPLHAADSITPGRQSDIEGSATQQRPTGEAPSSSSR